MYTIDRKLRQTRALISVIVVIDKSGALAEQYFATVIDIGLSKQLQDVIHDKPRRNISWKKKKKQALLLRLSFLLMHLSAHSWDCSSWISTYPFINEH